ncbi:Phenylalanine--tRNA ligase beta subunit [Thalassocella blandensis]|nr:Phenylalanine--tRNA ligase beta subunit [Thalassocella blandensis]
MKFSESWLREWVSPKISTQELVDQVTMAGLEVDAVEPVAGTFTGVVVGEILSAEQHPDADKLRVCKVAGSPDGEMQVVCGAPNARPGIKIPFALVGAKLPGDFKIKKAKLRGVESFGMLCAQTELEAGDDDSGLWELPQDAPVGTDLNEYLSLNDRIIEVDLTPNRSDCLSVKGLAREVGVLNKCEVTSPVIAAQQPAIDEVREVALNAGEACSRYIGRVINGVDVSCPSPLWLQEKLRRSGVRSIDAVVDVTNYVLLELGQPMHAFDKDKLSGGINVRLATQDEEITLLDDQEIKLNSDTLVIADESGPIAMAGIMGGASTAVSEATQNIFLESAFFHPVAIAGRARSYGLHTDSSHRFERGVDFSACEQAIERATELLLEIVGGDAGPIIHTSLEDQLPAVKQVKLAKARIQSGLGFAIPDAEVVDILTRLGMQLLDSSDQGWVFEIPSYRFDIAIEEDLLEELARIYGYNNLPTTEMRIPGHLDERSEAQFDVPVLEGELIARGYQEVITYSFIDPKLHAMFDSRAGIELLNPISADMSTMRTTLIPGLVNTLKYNLNRQKNRVRIFETGLRFYPAEGESRQIAGIAGLIYGSKNSLSWHSDKKDVDFYDIKGDIEALLNIGKLEYSFAAGKADYLHPGQTADISLQGKKIGQVGALHPQILQALDIPKSAFVFELDLDPLRQAVIPSCDVVSRFPEVARDLALVVDRTLPWGALEAAVKEEAGEHLKNLKVFDVYAGEGIDPKRKSVAFNLTFQHPSRTLNEEEINNPINSIVKRLEEEFNAILR